MQWSLSTPWEELGKDAIVKGENGEVTSGEQAYREGRSQAEGMLQIRFSPLARPLSAILGR